MFWYGGHWMFWQAGLMWLGMLVFWSLLILAIYALIRGTGRTRGTSEHGDDARGILDRRLAKGEIDTAEDQRLRDLLATDGRAAPRRV